MAESKALVWDEVGKREYRTGISNVAIFPYDTAQSKYGNGVAWSGVTSIEENPSGAEANDFYADNIKYLSLMSAEQFGCNINAYSYPDEVEKLNGFVEPVKGVKVGQQARGVFAMAYKNKIGNDTEGTAHGYELNLVWGAKMSPSSKNNQTEGESPEPTEFSWEVTTTPVVVAGYQPTAHIVINSTEVDSAKLTAFEAILFGSEDTEARIPLPDEVFTLFGAAAQAAQPANGGAAAGTGNSSGDGNALG